MKRRAGLCHDPGGGPLSLREEDREKGDGQSHLRKANEVSPGVRSLQSFSYESGSPYLWLGSQGVALNPTHHWGQVAGMRVN